MSLTSDYHQEVRDRIVYQLASEPLTTRELEVRLGYSYTTTRRGIQELMDTGAIMRFDKRARNGKYVICKEGNAPTAVVPSVQYRTSTIKLTDLYLDQGIEEIAKSATDTILRAWATIATTARRLHEEIPEASLMGKLKRQKVELTNARSTLENLIFIINQLLDIHKLWEPEHLVNFPLDPAWETFLPHLQELYNHYYGATE